MIQALGMKIEQERPTSTGNRTQISDWKSSALTTEPLLPLAKVNLPHSLSYTARWYSYVRVSHLTCLPHNHAAVGVFGGFTTPALPITVGFVLAAGVLPG